MARVATIPISFVELLIAYSRPDIKVFNDRTVMVQSIFDALSPWSPKLDDIEPLTTGKLSEQGFNFKLPLKQISFFFGPASCRFTRDNADWSMAEETLAILDAGLSAFVEVSHISFGVRTAGIGVHVQPSDGAFMEILAPFVPPQLASIEREPVKTMAVVVKWGKRKITLDGSGVLANAVFLKFEREFEGTDTLEAIARQLRLDEEQLFRILGVEEAQG
jgi:hypothetical protein